MEELKRALSAIRADSGRAVEVLTLELDRDRARMILALAMFIVAALEGVVIDPDNL